MSIAVDTSAVIAFLTGEDGALAIAECLAASRRKFMSSGTYLECGIVIRGRLGEEGWRGSLGFYATRASS